MLYRLSERYFLIGLFLFVSIGQNIALSQSRIIPTLQVDESFLSNKTSALSESGQITAISPGIRYLSQSSRSDFSLDYSLNALYYNDLSQQDKVDQNLSLQWGITHAPNHWDTNIRSSISQANVSSDGIQIVNPNFQSDNTRELRTFGVGTSLRGKWSRNIDYQSILDADYAAYEGSDHTDSVSISLALSSNSSQQKLHWSTSFSSRISSALGDDEQIDTIRGELNYRISQKYSTFLSTNKSETNSDFLNETNTTVGVVWTPDKNSLFKLGTGKRGSDTTYTLESRIKSQRTTYSATYDETVTTSRALLIDEGSNQQIFSPTTQSLSITPVLLSNGRISIMSVGRRTSLTLSYFKQVRRQPGTSIIDDKTGGLSFSVNRTLSRVSSASFNISHRKIENTQKNTVNDVGLAYDRQWSKIMNLSVELRESEQISDVVINEYKQTLLNFGLSATF